MQVKNYAIRATFHENKESGHNPRHQHKMVDDTQIGEQSFRVFEYSCPGIRRFVKRTIKDEKELYTYSLQASEWREKKME